MIETLEPVLGEVFINSYQGKVDEDLGLYEGKAVLNLDNNSNYDGNLHLGKMHGKGKFTWNDGVCFEGDFVNGEIHGEGIFTWINRATYKGAVKKGKRDGFGRFESNIGQIYEGEWEHGKRNGKGKMIYNKTKTVTYEGYWINGERVGVGIMTYASGNIYEGQWLHDKKNGKGMMQWKDRQEVYIGDWKDDQCDGYGEHYWDSNELTPIYHRSNSYRGHFKEGKRHGFGTFFYSDGTQYSGMWVNNKKDDTLGIFRSIDGRLSIGHYQEDRIITCTERNVSTLGLQDFSTYTHLNIMDVICNVDATIDPFVFTSFQDSLAKKQSELAEIERLLLRYDSYLKKVYRHYRDISITTRQSTKADRERQEKQSVQAKSQNVLESMHDMVAFFTTRRHTSDRLFCMSFGTFIQFCRESGTIDSSFLCYDIQNCFYAMQQQQKAIVASLLQPIPEVSPLASDSVDSLNLNALYQEEEGENVGSVVEESLKGYAENVPRHFEFYMSVDNPSMLEIDDQAAVTERDFAELFVRCHMHKARNTTVSGGRNISTLIHETLANQLVPFSTSLGGESSSSADSHLYRAMYSPEAQLLFSQHTTLLRNIVWAPMLEKSGMTSVVSSAHIVKYFLSLRSVLFVDTMSVSTILSAINTGDDVDQMSFLQRCVTFRDFYDFLCRLLLSGLYMDTHIPVDEIRDAELLDTTPISEQAVTPGAVEDGTEEPAESIGTLRTPEVNFPAPPHVDVNISLVERLSHYFELVSSSAEDLPQSNEVAAEL